MAIDLINRELESAIIDLGQQAKELSKACNNVVANFKSSKEEDVRKKIKDATEEIIVKMDPNAKKEEEKEKSWVKTVVDFFTSHNKSEKSGKQDNKTASFETYLARIANATDHLSKDCSIWVGICGISETAQKQIAKAIRMSNCCMAISGSAKAANRATAKSDKGVAAATSGVAAANKSAMDTFAEAGVKSGKKDMSGMLSSMPDKEKVIPLAKAMTSIEGKFGFLLNTLHASYKMLENSLNLGFGENVLKGVVQESNNFRENMRQILFQQVGFTKENRNAEASYMNVTNAVYASAVSKAQFENLWLRTVQRGYAIDAKGAKTREGALARMKSTVTSAANTAKGLGMDVNATTEMFMDWHQHLALSANDMAEMGRHMQNISRTTGLTGSELQKAMGSATKITKALQSAGLASVEAMKAATKLATIASKYGASEDIGNIMKALSGSKNFFDAPKEMQAMLTRSAAMTQGKVTADQVMSGAVSGSPRLQRELFKGMELDTRRFLSSSLSSLGIDANTMDLTKINDTIQKVQQKAADSTNPLERNQANNALIALGKLATQMGTDLGGLQARMKTMQESQLSSGERLAKMTKEYNAALVAGKGGLDSTKQLEKQVIEARSSALMDAINKTNKVFREEGVNSMGQLGATAKESLKKGLQEELGQDLAGKFMTDQKGAIGDLIKDINKRASNASINVSKYISDKGYSSMDEIQKALQSPSGDKRDAALEALNEVTQVISRKERESQDPVTNIRGTLQDMNTWLRTLMDKMLGVLIGSSNTLTSVLYSVGQLASVAISILGIMALYKNASMLANAAKGIAAAAGSAGTTAAGSALGSTAAGAAGSALGSTAAGAAGSTAANAAKGGWRLPRISGKGALIAAGVAAAGAYLYSKWNSKKETPAGEGMSEDSTVIDLLRKIEMNTRGGGGGKGGGGIGGTSLASANEPASAADSGSSELVKAGAMAGTGALAASMIPKSAPAMVTPPPLPPAITGPATMPSAPAVTPPTIPSPPPASSGGIFSKIGSKIGSAWQSTKDVAGSAWQSTKNAAGTAGRYVLDKTGLSKVTGWLSQNIGGIMPKFLKTSGDGFAKKLLGSMVKNFPIVGSMVELGFLGHDAYSIARTKGLSEEEMYAQIGEAAISTGLGLMAGTLAAGITSLAYPPSAIAAPLSYMGGNFLGRLIGSAISNYIGGPALGRMLFPIFAKSKKGNVEEGEPQVELAEGGIVTRPTRALIGEAGPEAVLPLKGNLDVRSESMESKLDSLASTISSIFKSVQNNIANKLNTTIGEMSNKLSGSISMLSLGAFEKGEVSDAIDQATQTGIKMSIGMFPINEIFGLFDKLTSRKDGESKSFKELNKNISQMSKVDSGFKSERIEKSMESTVKEMDVKEFSIRASSVNISSKSYEKESIEDTKNIISGINKQRAAISHKYFGAFEPQEGKNAIEHAQTTSVNELLATSEMTASRISESIKEFGDHAKDSYYESSGINNSLSSAYREIEARSASESFLNEMGLFAPNQIENALDVASKQYFSEKQSNQEIASSVFEAMKERNSLAMKGNASQMGAGLFSKEQNISQASEESVNNVAGNIINTSDISNVLANTLQQRQELQKSQRSFADLSRSLSYETSASDIDADTVAKKTELSSMPIGDVGTNALDYTDDISGTVSTLLNNRDSVETYLERERASANSGNAVLLPSMDTIASYLVSTQAEKLDSMIELLEAIKVNTAATGGYISNIIGPVSDGLPPMSRPGVKSMAHDYTRGKWDLTFIDSSPSSVTTEGRGGSA